MRGLILSALALRAFSSMQICRISIRESERAFGVISFTGIARPSRGSEYMAASNCRDKPQSDAKETNTGMKTVTAWIVYRLTEPAVPYTAFYLLKRPF